MASMLPIALLSLLLAAAPKDGPPPPPARGEALVSIDVKDASVADFVRLLAEVGRFQVVMDPGAGCSLTLKLDRVRWPSALDAALRSCALEREEEGGILRIAPRGRLAAEHAERRKLAELRQEARPRTVTAVKLSYARASQLAPIVKSFLSPTAEVFWDERTNTLVIKD